MKIGYDVEVEELERLYHAIVFTVGCETDRSLGVPGEDLPGSAAATAFVGWYNATPTTRTMTPTFPPSAPS